MTRVRIVLACALFTTTFATTPTIAIAQNSRAPLSADARLYARAESLTVGDYCRAARSALASVNVVKSLGPKSAAAEISTELICSPLLNTATLLSLRGDQPASLKSVARINAGQYAELNRRTLIAMKAFFTLVRSDDMVPVTKEALDDGLNTLLIRTTETVNSLLSAAARDSALVRLANYERKLGPTSARLNIAEVLLNYGAQRFIPGFMPGTVSGPSPWEIVAAYVPTYGTIANKRAQAVSVAEFGLRHYLFGKQFGATGREGILRPTYWSAGALVVSDDNGALVWPWRDKQRVGAYISWGALKLGYVHGRNGEFLVSRQLQVIPFLF